MVEAPAPRGLTITVGMLPLAVASVRTLAALPLLSMIQLPGEDTSVSLKMRLPIVRDESRRTTRSSTNSSEEKSAVADAGADDAVDPVRIGAPQSARSVLNPDSVAGERTRVDLARREPAIQRVARDVCDTCPACVHIESHAALACERLYRNIEDAAPGLDHT